jgi:uncharacterized protein (DUF885 family)
MLRGMRLFRSLLAGLLALAAAPGLAQDVAGEGQEISRRLNQLYLDHAVAIRSLFPLGATANGFRAYDAQFANWLTEEHREAHRRQCRSDLESLRLTERTRLAQSDRLNYDVFERLLERCLESLDFDYHLLPIDQGGFSLPATFPIFGSGRGGHPFRNVRDYDNFLKRIPGFVEWMDTAIANMRRGMERGFVQPRAVMDKVLPQLTDMVVEDARQSLFYQPILNMPEAITGDDRVRLAVLYETAIRDRIVPAYRRVRDFVRDEYLPRCRATAGLAGLPGGDRMYAYAVRVHTTTRLTPQEIYDIGLREMARIRQDMEARHQASGHGGDFKAWAAQLKAQAPHYRTAEEVIAAYRAMHELVEPQLPKLFGRLPKAGYEIRRVEPHRENSAPSQYWRGAAGRPAVFYANLRALQVGPVTASASLFLHEALPGHHFQIRIQQENTSLPNFRRIPSYTAFIEGWARYAESLGSELGLYDDPYQRLAWMNADLSMAARLVMDVGIHAKGWTREQAMSFMRDNTLNAVLYDDAERGYESLAERFMAWPGQALAYKIGELKIRELRARAESRLGPKFDLRAFHDELLKDGAMPFDILDAKMDRWLAAQSR